MCIVMYIAYVLLLMSLLLFKLIRTGLVRDMQVDLDHKAGTPTFLTSIGSYYHSLEIPPWKSWVSFMRMVKVYRHNGKA